MLRERTLHHPIAHRDRVTATEIIDGIKCRVVLEQDRFGRYRETSILPCHGDSAREVIVLKTTELQEALPRQLGLYL